MPNPLSLSDAQDLTNAGIRKVKRTSMQYSLGGNPRFDERTGKPKKQPFAGRLPATLPIKKQRPIPAFKKGGKVTKTGPALVHKGEVVMTKEQAQKMKKKMKGMKKMQTSDGYMMMKD